MNGRIAVRVGLLLGGVLAAIGVLTIVEIVLRLSGTGPPRHDPFAGFSNVVPVFDRTTRPDGTEIYRTSPARQVPAPQEFLASKPAGGFRAFVVGGSSAAGVPYSASQAFSAWLDRRLRAEVPGVHIEVVNAAISGYASRRILAVVRELTRYEPDLVIVYAGHNEFAERRFYKHLL